MSDKKWKKVFQSFWKREGNTFIQFLLDAGLDVNALNKFGTTLLTYAAECGILEIVEFLVQKGADGNVANSDGSTPLHIAAWYGHKDILKFFLDRGISVDNRDKHKCTALHYVAAKDISSIGRESYQELVHMLIDHNADLNARNCKGCTPLLVAARKSSKLMVELFIKLGANLDYREEYQGTVLHYACRLGWAGIVRTLVEGSYNINLDSKTSTGYAPVILAAHSSNEDIVKLLVNSGANVNCKGVEDMSLLHYACEEGWLDVVKSLVRKRCDLNARDIKGKTPLHYACKKGWLSLVKSVVCKEYSLNAKDIKGKTPLHYACKLGWLDIVKYFVSKGCNLNAEDFEGRTPLHYACNGEWLDIVKFLVSKGCNLNAEDYECITPLHYACKGGWLNIVKSLVSKACNLNAGDFEGKTPLHYACKGGWLDIVKYLLSKGCNLNAKDIEGKTPLHDACNGEWLDIVKFLVSKGCDLNAKDFKGYAPLFSASTFPDFSVIEYFIECRADVMGCNTEGWTLLHYASERGMLDLVKFLVKKGCDINAKDNEGDTALIKATDFQSFSIIKYLIELGADVTSCNKLGWTVLHGVCEGDSEESEDLVELILKKGANANLNCQSSNPLGPPLHVASRCGNLEIIKKLLDAGADCNVVNCLGDTAFNNFKSNPSLKGTVLFLQRGAYFQLEIYTKLSEESYLKEGILQNTQLCSMAVMNQFNNAELPKIYKINVLCEKLPSIDKLKIKEGSTASANVVRSIKDSVDREIETKGYCNVINLRPLVLKRLCVLTLLKHYCS